METWRRLSEDIAALGQESFPIMLQNVLVVFDVHTQRGLWVSQRGYRKFKVYFLAGMVDGGVLCNVGSRVTIF